MNLRNSIAPIALAAALCVTLTDVWAQEVAKYPDWKGQWSRIVVPGVSDGLNPSFDQTKDSGFAQEAPLTPEYRKVLEESLADQAKGGIGNYYTILCRARGMPHMMTFGTHEYIVTPETTYILLGGDDRYRRISPTDVAGPRTSSRPIRAFRSAHGSTRTATAATTCLRWRRADPSRAPALWTNWPAASFRQ